MTSPSALAAATPARTAARSTSRWAARTPSTESLLDDSQFVALIRWVFTARLVCLALAAPAALTGPSATAAASASLCLLTVWSLVVSRSSGLIRTMIRHPLLASVDVAIAVVLLTSIDARQPAALTVVCSALAAGMLFSRRFLMPLMVPLVACSVGASVTALARRPEDWQGWLGLVAGLPVLVVGVCTIGSVVRHNVQATLRARQEVAEAVSAVGAAEERARLARDMHDSVGKSIHGISLGAKALVLTVGRDPQAAQELARALAEAADHAARDARAILVSLRRGQHDRPTVEVLRDLVEQWQRETGLAARLTTVQAVDADPEVTREMAYALGEILHNVHQHAEAHQVEVVLRGDPDLVELLVTDDGRGFDLGRVGEREAAGHYGLRGLRERAERLGGELEMESDEGRGTSIRWTARRAPA